MDKFFAQKHCDRCGKDLSKGRTMSMFNEECICLECKEKERQDKDYEKAVKAEHEAVKRGNYNFPGIRK